MKKLWIVLGAVLLATTFAFGQSAPQTIQNVSVLGTTSVKAGPLGSGAFQLPEIDTNVFAGDSLTLNAAPTLAPTWRRRANLPIPGKVAALRSVAIGTSAAIGASSVTNATLPLPEPIAPRSTVVNSQGEGFIGFDGLNHIDQRTANSGNQFSLEPPDQGLCAGNGFVVETVNDVIRVYDKHGTPLTGVEDMNSFFGLAPAIVRGTPNVLGPFLADPRCYYDAQAKRWFVSELEQDNGNNTGATGRFYNLLAVSQTSDPTGGFTVFQYDVTDDGLNGTPSHAGCPCFGDQPLLGADKYGVYQSTNEFGAGFNGAQIYAISKSGLVAAADLLAPPPVVVALDVGQLLLPFGGLSYSVQPATSPKPDPDADNLHGVEYFLSALQFGNPGYEVYDNRIAVWAITNTKSLKTNSPVLTVSFNVLHSETYGQPDPAAQRSGPIPLGTSLGDSLELIDTNDDRMNQVTFADGILYSGVNSKLSVGGASQTGAAWFAVKPSFRGPTLQGRIVNQGYVAVKGNNVIFPSLGVTRENEGVIVYTLVGPDYFPSVAYSLLGNGNVPREVHIAGAGQGPEDGFTGYPQFTGTNVARWGDYSAATFDGDRVWFASEYIPNSCTGLALPCRTLNANWGTFVASVKP